MMEFHPYGDSALLISFDQRIDPRINTLVIDLNRAIDAASLPGVLFTIPAYCSLTIGFDPFVTGYEQLRGQLETLAAATAREPEKYSVSRTLLIPVCYETPYCLDFDELGQQTGLQPKEIIHWHTNTPFRVYMLGFLPGFAYMGRLPEALVCNRKTTPRLRVPAQSVGLAGYQTGIYPTEAPGGWQIIGRTPVKPFDPGRNDPFLFQPGDRVLFQAISSSTYQRIETEVATGAFDPKSLYA